MKKRLTKGSSIRKLGKIGIFNKNILNYDYNTIIKVNTNQKFENLKSELNNFRESLFNFVNTGDDKIKISIQYNDKRKFKSVINKYF